MPTQRTINMAKHNSWTTRIITTYLGLNPVLCKWIFLIVKLKFEANDAGYLESCLTHSTVGRANASSTDGWVQGLQRPAESRSNCHVNYENGTWIIFIITVKDSLLFISWALISVGLFFQDFRTFRRSTVIKWIITFLDGPLNAPPLQLARVSRITLGSAQHRPVWNIVENNDEP